MTNFKTCTYFDYKCYNQIKYLKIHFIFIKIQTFLEPQNDRTENVKTIVTTKCKT